MIYGDKLCKTYIFQEKDALSIQFHSHRPNTGTHPVSPSKSDISSPGQAIKLRHAQ